MQDFLARKKILFVCKQIQNEAEKIFYDENTFAVTLIATSMTDKPKDFVEELLTPATPLPKAMNLLSFVAPHHLHLMNNMVIRFGCSDFDQGGRQHVDKFDVLDKLLRKARKYLRSLGIPPESVHYGALGGFENKWAGDGVKHSMKIDRSVRYDEVDRAVKSSVARSRRACNNMQ
jgi:hypothetical protein